MYPNPQDAVPLPPHPDLEQYRKRAKELLKAAKAGPDAIRAWAVAWVGHPPLALPRPPRLRPARRWPPRAPGHRLRTRAARPGRHALPGAVRPRPRARLRELAQARAPHRSRHRRRPAPLRVRARGRRDRERQPARTRAAPRRPSAPRARTLRARPQLDPPPLHLRQRRREFTARRRRPTSSPSPARCSTPARKWMPKRTSTAEAPRRWHSP